MTLPVRSLRPDAKAAIATTGLVRLTGTSNENRKAAAQYAERLGRPLQRVALSTIVSAYAGETEKNLDRVFAEARGAGAVLWFDEADALFGKRTGVSDAHDRYANVEAALLKRVERDGVAVVTTSTDGKP